MFSYAKMLAVAVAALAAPVAANAAVIQVNQNIAAGAFYNFAEILYPGSEYEYIFTAVEALVVDSFAVGATSAGPRVGQAAADINHVKFGFTAPPTQSFDQVVSFGNSAAGLGQLPGGTYSAGEQFSIFFSDGVQNPVTFGLSFQTAEVPLPAAGLMLAPMLIGGGVVALRRRKAARNAA